MRFHSLKLSVYLLSHFHLSLIIAFVNVMPQHKLPIPSHRHTLASKGPTDIESILEAKNETMFESITDTEQKMKDTQNTNNGSIAKNSMLFKKVKSDEDEVDEDLIIEADARDGYENDILDDTNALEPSSSAVNQTEIDFNNVYLVKIPENADLPKIEDNDNAKSYSLENAKSSLGSFLLQRRKIEEDEIQKIKSTTGVSETSSEQDSATSNEDKETNISSINPTGVQRDFDDALQKFASDAETTITSFIDTYTGSNQSSIGVNNKIDKGGSHIGERKGKQNKKDRKMIKMDQEQIREVDESVSILTGSGSGIGRKEIMKHIEILRDVPSTVSIPTSEKKEEVALLPLSEPEHIARIEMDMKRLSVSIASDIESVDQWKVFCEDGGGVLSLLECIRDGAREIRHGPISIREDSYDESVVGLVEQQDAAFEAACKACKTLRDLCVISKPFSAVITDSILRADSVWATRLTQKDGKGEKLSGGLISDLAVLLKYSADADKLYSRGGDSKYMQNLKNRGLDIMSKLRRRRITGQSCVLYVVQLLLAMSFASDKAVDRLRATSGFTDTVLSCSSYAQKERLRRRWIRYPIEVIKRRFKSNEPNKGTTEDPFLTAASVSTGLSGQIQGTSNQLLAAIGYNEWYPKTAGQRGLRILCLDGGGTRGITAISSMRSIVDALGGIEVCDAFDMIAGTSTGAIIAFLVGLRRESSVMARKRYDKLIKMIFVKSALSTPMLLLTTATYDESPFNQVMKSILRDNSMLASRADPRVPLVFAISSKMSSTPTQLCLLRNYNYNGGEMKDAFVQDPIEAKEELGLSLKDDVYKLSGTFYYDNLHLNTETLAQGSRHPGSFRVLQRAALRATTAAPTVFKPVLMGGELYCDGGIVASNPAAIAIHEAKTIFPNVPIEMIVSCGTGAFVEEKSEPRIGWVSAFHCQYLKKDS